MSERMRVYGYTGVRKALGLGADAFMKARREGRIPVPGIKLKLDGEVQEFWSPQQLETGEATDILYLEDYASITYFADKAGVGRNSALQRVKKGMLGEPDLILFINQSQNPRRFWIYNDKNKNIVYTKDRHSYYTGREVAKVVGKVVEEAYRKAYRDAIEKCKQELEQEFKAGLLFNKELPNEREKIEILPKEEEDNI